MSAITVPSVETQTCWGVVTLRGEPLACPAGSLCAAPKIADELALCDRMMQEPAGTSAARMRAAHAARLVAEPGWWHQSAAACKPLLVSLRCFGLLR